MRRRDSQNIKSALSEFIKANRMEQKWSEHEIKDKWNALLGPMVANRTTQITLRNKVLYVKLSSAALRNELMMSRSKIVASLNEEMDAEIITDIVLK